MLTLAGDFAAAKVVEVKRGEEFFEWSNHLGNVLATVSDRKIAHTSNSSTIDYYEADVVSAQDYYPFGMIMPGRTVINGSGYRYGFNGKEKDKETASTATYDYGFRIYNPALGKFLSVDPLTKSYPWYTPYQFAGNKPIWAVDLDGLEEVTSTFFKAIFGSPAGYAKPKTALDQLNKDRFTAQKNFAESRTGKFLGGATNFTLGTIGVAGTIAYLGGTDGLGTAFGGSLALQFSLSEMAIGVTQMFDAFSSKNMTPYIHEAGSIPGLIAYGTDSRYAPFFDALGQFMPTLATAGSFKGLIKSGLGVIDAARTFSNTPSIANALATLDQVSDAKGFVLESLNLISKTKDSKLIQRLEYSFSYTIQKGETLTSLANKFGTTVENISKQNNISKPDELSEGQKIKFKGFANGSSGGAGTSVTY